jgi:predicted transcriptional regulator
MGVPDMSQQNIYPQSSEEKQVEHKIMILLLVDKIDIPISNSQITKFALEENYMNYYDVQQYLKQMVELGYLDSSQLDNITRYTITDEGLKALETFAQYVPPYVKTRILKYIEENRNIVQQDLEIAANHFYQHDNEEYLVKCAVYEEDNVLMELNLSVVTKEQAIIICNNWKNNVGRIYAQIIDILLNNAEEPDEGFDEEQAID